MDSKDFVFFGSLSFGTIGTLYKIAITRSEQRKKTEKLQQMAKISLIFKKFNGNKLECCF